MVKGTIFSPTFIQEFYSVRVECLKIFGGKMIFVSENTDSTGHSL